MNPFKPWFVGAMNDALFIIDQPPRPSNDDINPDQNVNVIAKVANLGPDGDSHARLLSAAPLLLNRLQTLTRIVESRFEGLEIVASVPRELRAAVVEAKAAITRATPEPVPTPA